MLEQSRRSESEKPGRTVRRAGYGGIAVRGNTDTMNPVGVVLVDQEGLPGLDVPYPEW